MLILFLAKWLGESVLNPEMNFEVFHQHGQCYSHQQMVSVPAGSYSIVKHVADCSNSCYFYMFLLLLISGPNAPSWTNFTIISSTLWIFSTSKRFPFNLTSILFLLQFINKQHHIGHYSLYFLSRRNSWFLCWQDIALDLYSVDLNDVYFFIKMIINFIMINLILPCWHWLPQKFWASRPSLLSAVPFHS